MILGNLNKVFDREESIFEAIQNNFNQSYDKIKKPTKWSKLLRSLSTYGMNYDDEVYKNMVAVPADKNLQDKDDFYLAQSYYNSPLNNWRQKQEEDKAYNEGCTS